ncbi:MAG: hypothetical protein EHM28_05850 [Spirochaetaceae bacterium]|nr:MAG: hypothetical protein EHM28_05850 [Spirochaetaceae bacterium]
MKTIFENENIENRQINTTLLTLKGTLEEISGLLGKQSHLKMTLTDNTDTLKTMMMDNASNLEVLKEILKDSSLFDQVRS